jgi:uncharacterized protein with ParB-like and HNH nuclease domain
MQKTETGSVDQAELTLQQQFQQEIETLKSQNERMKNLSTRASFFNEYVLNLPFYETAVACFNSINDEYHSLFGQYRYSNYDNFKYLSYLN